MPQKVEHNKMSQNEQIEQTKQIILPKIVHKKLEQESYRSNKILRTIERNNERKLKLMKNGGFDHKFVLV